MTIAASPTAQQALAQAEFFLTRRDLQQAAHALDQAHALGADADSVSGQRWQLAMLSGDFEAAWQQADALRHRNAPDPHRFWNGDAIDGKHIIVRCLHGFGDAVQMLRYAAQLRARAAHVVFELPPTLYPLGHCFKAVEDVITWGDQAPPVAPSFDVQLEVMELPYLFRTTLADLPIATNYLHLRAAKHRLEPLSSTSKLRVGIIWSAGSWNPSRSIPLQLLEPLLKSGRFEFWNLQGQGSAAEASDYVLPAPADGILPLAETIAQLDLVITVDTLAAHLTGALSVPCWLLLQYAADWRWLHGRLDSPWYPSLTLFRQPTPGNWAAVVAQVQQRLATLNA